MPLCRILFAESRAADSGRLFHQNLELVPFIVQQRNPSLILSTSAGLEQFAGTSVDSPDSGQPDFHYVLKESAGDRQVLPIFFLLLLSIPFEWLRVSWIGHRSVLMIPLLLLVLEIAKSPESGLRRLQKFLHLAPVIHGLYVAYLGCLTCAAFWGPNLTAGLAELGRAWTLFGFYIIVGTYLTEKPSGAIASTLLTAVPLAILGFVAYCFFVFWAQGDSLIAQLEAAVYSGGSNAVANRVLKNVVNYQFRNTSSSDRLEIVASVRNATAAAMLLLLIMSWVYAAAIPRVRRTIWHSLALGFISLGVPVVLVVLMSRSSLISLAAAGVICAMMYHLSHRGRLNSNVAIGALLLLIVSGGVGMMLFVHPEENALVSLNVQRMNEISGDVRIQHYRGVYEAIQRRPLLGYGLGAETPDGLTVHNLFLGAWFRAGVMGLLLSVSFYIALLCRWVIGCLELTGSSLSLRNLPSFVLLPALMVEPLSRAPLIGGQDGRFIRVEWLAIACFLTAVETIRNQSRRKLCLIDADQDAGPGLA
jgi:O-antigen ligase